MPSNMKEMLFLYHYGLLVAPSDGTNMEANLECRLNFKLCSVASEIVSMMVLS